MRVCQLNPYYFPYAGGIERRIRATARRLAHRHDVHIVTAQLPGTRAGATEEQGVTVHRLPSRFPLRRLYNPSPVLTTGLTRTLDRIDPDVVDYHFRWSPSYNRAARNLRRARLVVTYHNTWGEGSGLLGLLSRINDHRFRRTLGHARRIVAVSRFIHDDLAAHGVAPDRIRIVPNGLDPEDEAATRDPPQNAPGGPYLLFVGRLVALKGLRRLVDALAEAPPDLHLVLVGRGPERARLIRHAHRRGLADRVHLPGWVDEDEKRRLMSHALAYAHPARFEAFGLSVLEAMAAGTPVIASDAGGLPELVDEAGLVLPLDTAAWTQAIGRLATDEAERARLSAAARRRSLHYTWDAMTRRLDEVYQEAARA